MNAISPSQLFYAGVGMLGMLGMYMYWNTRDGNISNAKRTTLRRRMKYGGRKGRRAMIRLYGSRAAYLRSMSLGDLLLSPDRG